jgi:hypothetical protein
MDVDAPRTRLDGVAVADDVNVSDDVTVMVPAASFQYHCCQVELKTPRRTRKLPETAGVNASQKYLKF